MAYNLQTSIPISFQCGEDLSNNQFLFVRLGTDGLLHSCDQTSYALGILNNAPSPEVQGQYAGTVDLVGVSRLAVHGVYPVGTWLTPGVISDATGIGMSLADALSVNGQNNNNYIRAWSLQASTARYDVVAVQLLDLQGPASGSAGATGLQGSTGVQGLSITGSTGVQGLIGATGVQGTQGVTGVA